MESQLENFRECKYSKIDKNLDILQEKVTNIYLPEKYNLPEFSRNTSTALYRYNLVAEHLKK